MTACAKRYFKSARGSHGWDHTLRVLNMCMHIGPVEGCDMGVLSLAALLHDIGREESDKNKGKTCHAKEGAVMARKILADEGAPPETVDPVIHCIETHRFRGDLKPVSIEAKVLYDADKLDSLGAVGVGRAFQFAGEIGATTLHDPDVDPAATKSYGPHDTAYREYLVKLMHIKEKLVTATGKKIAEGRHDFMERFFERLNDEANGLS